MGLTPRNNDFVKPNVRFFTLNDSLDDWMMLFEHVFIRCSFNAQNIVFIRVSSKLTIQTT